MMFKRMFSVNVMIDFIGVWYVPLISLLSMYGLPILTYMSCRDTVDSVGLFPRTLPFADSDHAIRVFRHALALDERRVRFQPSLYQYPTSENQSLRKSLEKQKPKHGIIPSICRWFGFGLSDADWDEMKEWHYQMLHDEHPQWYPPTKVLEVWFAGCHCGTSLLLSHLHNCSCGHCY